MFRKYMVILTRKLGIYKWTVDKLTLLINKRKNYYFRKYAIEALTQADKAFQSVDSFIFLTFGTLLGAYREHDFIKYDNDIDVGFLATKKPDNLQQLLESFGFKKIKHYYFKEGNRVVIEAYTYKNVQLDFFSYYEDGDDYFCYWGKRHESKSAAEANESDGFPSMTSRVERSTFSKKEFKGQSFYMADKTAIWLEDIYGKTFMTPVKNWDADKYERRVAPYHERLYRKYFK